MSLPLVAPSRRSAQATMKPPAPSGTTVWAPCASGAVTTGRLTVEQPDEALAAVMPGPLELARGRACSGVGAFARAFVGFMLSSMLTGIACAGAAASSVRAAHAIHAPWKRLRCRWLVIGEPGG